MKRETKEKLNGLHEEDVYSRALFALFVLSGDPEYSSLSELAYLLDSKGLLNLVEYYGGTTLRIPTMAQLKTIIQSQLLYTYVNVEGMDYDKAVKLLDTTTCPLNDIKECYTRLVGRMSNYEFDRK